MGGGDNSGAGLSEYEKLLMAQNFDEEDDEAMARKM